MGKVDSTSVTVKEALLSYVKLPFLYYVYIWSPKNVLWPPDLAAQWLMGPVLKSISIHSMLACNIFCETGTYIAQGQNTLKASAACVLKYIHCFKWQNTH